MRNLDDFNFLLPIDDRLFEVGKKLFLYEKLQLNVLFLFLFGKVKNMHISHLLIIFSLQYQQHKQRKFFP